MFARTARRRSGVAGLVLILLMAIQAPPLHAAAPQLDWSSAVQHALPAVVNISIETITDTNGVERRGREVGTGFLIDPSGIIATNKHVIEGAFRITVTLPDRSQWNATLIAAARLLDVAVLQIDVGHPLPYLKFADSDVAEVGDPVVVIGNPLGLGTSVSTGVISAVHRDLGRTPVDDYLQTDASINRGNSGGPILDRDGNVLAISTILVTPAAGQGSSGLGFGISATLASFSIHHMLNPRDNPIGWIGVRLQDVTSALQRAFGLQDFRGAVITQVDPGSPAAQAGLRPGDVIVRYGTLAPPGSRELMRQIIISPPGSTIPLMVERDATMNPMHVTVGEWHGFDLAPEQVLNTMATAVAARPPDLGLILTEMTDAARDHYNISIDRGVIVAAVNSASEAYSSGIKAGDVILQVQDIEVGSPDEANRVIDQARATRPFIALLVANKDGDKRWFTLYSGRTSTATR